MEWQPRYYPSCCLNRNVHSRNHEAVFHGCNMAIFILEGEIRISCSFKNFKIESYFRYYERLIVVIAMTRR